MARFKNLCEKYHLGAGITFATVCHARPFSYYELQVIKRQGQVSEGRRKIWFQLMEKFCNDLENGHYNLVFNRARTQKRVTPLKVTCPMGALACAGGVLPQSCPRHWAECPLDGGIIQLTM
jgi:hypothetical protein